MSKSWILAFVCGLTLALSLVLSLSNGASASVKDDDRPADSMAETVVKQHITGTAVSQLVLPVDTSNLAPVPLSQEVVEIAMPLEHTLPLANAMRTTGDPPTIDPLVQNQTGQENMPAPEKNWEGIPATGVFPPDTDGQVGRDHYVQIVNASGQGSQIRVWDKNGNQLYNFGFNSMYPSSGIGSRCRNYGYGDPVVLYDQMADRWLLTQFTNPPSAPYNECIAISKTNLPTNNPADWWLYEFNVHSTKFNDYPKFGIWPDGYYMTANQFTGGSTWGGAGVWVFNRTSLLSGGATSFIYFDLFSLNPNLGGLLPSNLLGSRLPPSGAPNYLMSVDMDWSGSGSSDVMHLFEVHTDWVNPSSSTVTWIKDLVVAPFDWNFANPGADIPQPSTAQGLDGLADRLMMHLWYRNLGTHEALVVNHTVDAGGDLHGIRWYEIRGGALDTSLADAFIYQQGTYAPDSFHRWMGSLAMDHMGNLALGYSVSSSSLYPSIRYTGRMVDDPLNTLPQGEVEIIAGSGSQTGRDSYGRGRWGDYSAMSVDPVDDCTFWYTQEYIQTTSLAGWRTRVAAFRFPNCTSGDTGRLVGTVSDASTSLPLSGVEVYATNGLSITASTTTHSDGGYTLTLPVSIYTVTAVEYGYLPGLVSGVNILPNSDTIQDFSLSPAPLYQVEGVIRDAAAGWPLYAKIQVEGLPLDPLWSDPVTGYYSVILPGGSLYTFSVEAVTPGYLTLQQVVGPISTDIIQDFHLHADLEACQSPGYGFDGLSEDFEGSVPPSGWDVINNAGNDVIWKSCTSWSIANYTDGAADCAAVVSKAVKAAYDTELRTPLFDSSTLFTKTLTFRANYQDRSARDYFDVDITNNDGLSWVNVLHWTTDHGANLSTPGELVTIDLEPYLSGNANRIRWRYANPAFLARDEYVEIDEVQVGSEICNPQPGGLVVGNVYDLNTNDPLNGATISNQDGYATVSIQTPEDTSVEDGFFTLFSPAGTRTFTATMAGGYAAVTDMLAVVSNDVILYNFFLPAGKLQMVPSPIEQTVPFAQQISVPVTLTNLGGTAVSFNIVDINQGFTPLGSTQYKQITIPGTTYNLYNHTIQKYRQRPPFIRPEINFQVPVFSFFSGFIDVLLLTPDQAAGGDINLIMTTLSAFSDINLSLWDTNLGDPIGDDLSAYDVIIVGNDYRWTTVGMTASGVGDALADYIDGGGKVIDSMFVHDWAGWELGGRYISGQYSPFTLSTLDFELVPYSLGTIYLPDHPVMQGVTTVTDDPSIGIGHQDVGLADGAARLVDWEDGQVYVALKGNVAGVNQLWFHGSNWSGDVPVLLHNLIRFLTVQDAGWLTENPTTGNLPALNQQVVLVTLNSADLSSGRRGKYLADLVITNDSPYGALSIPVVMTVTVPYELYLPGLSNNQP